MVANTITVQGSMTRWWRGGRALIHWRKKVEDGVHITMARIIL